MNTHTHPAVARYLTELTELLTDLEPVERAEVVAGVREHVDAALSGTPEPSDEQVAAVLAGLGSPATVAQEAYADLGTQRVTPVRWSRRGWVPVAVALCTLLAVMTVLLVSAGSAVVSESGTQVVEPDGTRVETSEVSYEPGSAFMGAVAGGLAALPLWLVTAVLVGVSPLWTRREKLLWLLLVPASALAVGVLPEIGWGLVGVNGIYVGAWTALALIVLGGGWLGWSLTRRGRDRSLA